MSGPWDDYASENGPWVAYQSQNTEPEPIGGAVGQKIADMVPSAIVNSTPFQTLAGLGGGIYNRTAGALKGAAEIGSDVANVANGMGVPGAAATRDFLNNMQRGADITIKGAEDSINSMGRMGRGAAIAGDIAPLMLAPGGIVGAALTDAATNPDANGLAQRTGTAAMDYVGGHAANFAANKVLSKLGATDIGRSLGLDVKKPIGSDTLHGLAQAQYAKAEKLGGTLSPNITNRFLVEADKTLRPQTAEGLMVAGEQPATKLADRLRGLVDRPLTLQAAQEIDEELGNTIDGLLDAKGRLTKQGKKVFDLQTAFRNAVNTAPDSEISGDGVGIAAWRQGQKYWAAMNRMRDVENIITRAEMMDNPATGIKTGFRTLYNNPSRIRGFDKETRELIKKAGKTGLVGDTLRTLGSRLVPIISEATLGPAAGLATIPAGMVARGAATDLQLGRAQKVANSIIKPLGLGPAAGTQVAPQFGAAAMRGLREAPSLLDSNKTDGTGAHPVDIQAPAASDVAPTVPNVIGLEEGFKATPYMDTTGHRTVGYGFNMEQPNAKALWGRAGIPENFDAVANGAPLSQASAQVLLAQASKAATRGIRKLVPTYDKLGDNQKAALASLAYQLGATGLSKFKRTLAYLQEGNAKAVENSLLNSRFAEQAPARARREALMLAYDIPHDEADKMLVEQGRIKPNQSKYL